MKKLLITCLSAILLIAFGPAAFSQQKSKSDKDDDDNSSWNGRPANTWDATIRDGMVNIQFYGRHWSEGRNFNPADFGALPLDKVGQFTLTREAGKMTFKGVFQGQFGHGTYVYEQNGAFKSWLEQKGYSHLDDDMMRAVFFTDISKRYFDYMAQNGYDKITNEEFKDLAQQNMSRTVMQGYFDMFKTEGFGRQSLEKIVV